MPTTTKLLALTIVLSATACNSSKSDLAARSNSTSATATAQPGQARTNQSQETPPAKAAQFTVLVRSAKRGEEPLSIEDPKALPAQSGGAMYLEAQLSEPAFIHLIWIDCTGRVNPLYPWNNETIETTDLNQTPPSRRASSRVFSPMLGRDWPLKDGSGMETVLLLIRRTPLPEGSNWGETLASWTAPPLRDPGEFVVFSLEGDKQHVKLVKSRNRGTEIEEADAQLVERMTALGKHFDYVEAVRFAHANAGAESQSP